MTRATWVGCVALAALVLAAPALQAQTVVGWRDRVIITASLPGMTAADRAVRQKLDETLVTFTFSDQPFEEAMDFLATLGGINIVIDRRAVEAGKTVTLKLSGVPLLTAVKLAVEQAGLKWAVRDGVVFIGDAESVKTEPVTVVYDVSDLLAPPPDFEGPEIELGSIGRQSGSTQSENPFPWPKDPEGEKKEQEKSREELLQEIVELVKQMIASGTWAETQ